MKSALIQIPGKIEELIEKRRVDLEDAWANAIEEGLTINFPVKIGFKNDRQICEVGISFVKDKVKETMIFEWNDKQMMLLNGVKK